MGSITIRNLDDPLKAELRIRAARHGRSMEEEVRAILREAISSPPAPGIHIVDAIRRRMAAVGGVDLGEIVREPMREPPDFEE